MNVYQMPNGTYKLAGRNVTDAVDMPDQSLTQKMGVKSLKALPGADKACPKVNAETGESFIPVSIEDAVAYWTKLALGGNVKAVAILAALAIEGIERRADAAFNVIRTEQERNERLQARVEGIVERNNFTKQLQEHGKKNKYTPNYGRITNLTYEAIGTTKGRKEKNAEELKEIAFIERCCARWIANGISPEAAIERYKAEFN